MGWIQINYIWARLFCIWQKLYPNWHIRYCDFSLKLILRMVNESKLEFSLIYLTLISSSITIGNHFPYFLWSSRKESIRKHHLLRQGECRRGWSKNKNPNAYKSYTPSGIFPPLLFIQFVCTTPKKMIHYFYFIWMFWVLFSYNILKFQVLCM